MAVNEYREPETHKITQALQDYRDQPDLLNERLFPLVYSAMKRIARRQMRGERSAVTLQPTVLVNEAYIRLVRSKPDWQNRAHFLACASNAMRQILIEHARRRKANAGAVVQNTSSSMILPKTVDFLSNTFSPCTRP